MSTGKAASLKPRTIAVTLGGQSRTLRFDMGAIALYEEATGESAMGGLNLYSFRGFRAILWAMLCSEDEEQERPHGQTVRQVGKWLEEPGVIESLTEEVITFVAANSPEPDPANEAGEGDDGPPDPTGSEAPTPSADSNSDSLSESSGG